MAHCWRCFQAVFLELRRVRFHDWRDDLWLRALSALLEDRSSFPNTHVEWFTMACKSSSGESDTFPGLCGYLYVHDTCNIYVHINKS